MSHLCHVLFCQNQGTFCSVLEASTWPSWESKHIMCHRYNLCDSTCALPTKFPNCLCLSVTRHALLSHLSGICMAFSRVALLTSTLLLCWDLLMHREPGLYSLCRLEQRCPTSSPTTGLPPSPPSSMPLLELERLQQGPSIPSCKGHCEQCKGNTRQRLHSREGSSLCCTDFPSYLPCCRKQSGNSHCIVVAVVQCIAWW